MFQDFLDFDYAMVDICQQKNFKFIVKSKSSQKWISCYRTPWKLVTLIDLFN